MFSAHQVVLANYFLYLFSLLQNMPARKRSYQNGLVYPKRRRKTRVQEVTPMMQVTSYRGRFANGGELKFHDVEVNDALIAQNGVIQNTGTINIIPQGTDENERVGRKCTIKSILWHYNLTLSESSSVGAIDTIRCILYLDKQANGLTAAATDLYKTDNYQSFRNLANSGRFEILYDKTHALNHQAAAGNGTANDAGAWGIDRSFYKTVNIPIEFSGTAGSLTQIRSNNLGILHFAKAGARVVLDSKIRLRFSDS